VFALVLAFGGILGLDFRGNERRILLDDGRSLKSDRGLGYFIDFRYRNWLFLRSFFERQEADKPITEGVKPTASKHCIPSAFGTSLGCFGTKNFFGCVQLHALLSSLTSSILFLTLRRISRLAGWSQVWARRYIRPLIFHAMDHPRVNHLACCFLIAALSPMSGRTKARPP